MLPKGRKDSRVAIILKSCGFFIKNYIYIYIYMIFKDGS